MNAANERIPASLVHSPMKVDRVLANHSLSSTASQGRSNNPISFFPALGITPPGEDTKEGKDREGMGCDSELAV